MKKMPMPMPRKQMPSPISMPVPAPTRKMPRFLILMPLVALTFGLSSYSASAEEQRPKSAKWHLRFRPTQQYRVQDLLTTWDTRLTKAKGSEGFRETHVNVNDEMEKELASLHRFLNPSLNPPSARAESPSDSSEDEKEETSLDASDKWAKTQIENWQFWVQTGSNPAAARRGHPRVSSVSLQSVASEAESDFSVGSSLGEEQFKKNHEAVKSNVTTTFLDLARKVDEKKKSSHRETSV